MDDGDGESVGGVIGLWHGLELEMNAYHFLDLGFVRHAVAADGVLNLVWAVFENGEIVLFGDEETDAAGFSDRDAGGNVLLKKELLNSHDVGMVVGDDFLEGLVNVEEAVGERSVGRSRDDAIIKRGRSLDYAKSTNASAGVDAENPTH